MAKGRSEKEVSAIVSGAGLISSVWTALEAAVREHGGNDRDLHRLSKPEGKDAITEMAQAIVAPRRLKSLGKCEEYRVHVNRLNLPRLETLLGLFDAVLGPFDEGQAWTKHPRRRGANDVKASEVVMVVKGFTEHEMGDREFFSAEDVIAWGSERGLVPADEQEVFAFGVNPETRDVQLKYALVGLGSFIIDGEGLRLCSELDAEDGKRTFEVDDYDADAWCTKHHFLFVRK